MQINNKSLYDPCPYGYRVPKNGSWTGFTVSNTGASGTINLGSTWSNTWWPIAGYRNNNSGAIGTVGNNANSWSSTRYTSGAYQSYVLYFNYDGSVGPSGNTYRSYGFSVRCVQEETRFCLRPPLRPIYADLGDATYELKNEHTPLTPPNNL